MALFWTVAWLCFCTWIGGPLGFLLGVVIVYLADKA